MISKSRYLCILYDVLFALMVIPFVSLIKFDCLNPFGNFYSFFYAQSSYLFFVLVLITIFGIHNRLWRYFSIIDLMNLILALGVANVVWYSFMHFTGGRGVLSWNFGVLILITSGIFLSGGRLLFRFLTLRHANALRNEGERVPVYVMGSLETVDSAIMTLEHPSYKGYEVIGVISVEENVVNKRVRNIPVVASVSCIDQFLSSVTHKAKKADLIFIADHDPLIMTPSFLRRFTKHGIATIFMKTIGHMTLRPEKKDDTQFDYDLLLRRSNYVLNPKHKFDLVQSKRILITGAGGSIGSEIVRQVVSFEPSEVILLDNCEYALYKIDSEITHKKSSFLCDVRDARSLFQIFEKTKPDIVFHAAAIKHVPIAEDNPAYTFEVNVEGTKNVIDACQNNVSLMVMISTDKAVNPTNIMGATKQIAERLLYSRSSQNTKFLTVRFGNVIGSNGSVLPLFNKQIDTDVSITITKEDIVRFFMTISEAVDLVLESAYLRTTDVHIANGIFVLDMGEQIKVQDMAELMVLMKGKHVNEVNFEYTGLRKGEKMYEELFNKFESKQNTPYEWLHLGVSNHHDTFENLLDSINSVKSAVVKGDYDLIMKRIGDMTLGYTKTL